MCFSRILSRCIRLSFLLVVRVSIFLASFCGLFVLVPGFLHYSSLGLVHCSIRLGCSLCLRSSLLLPSFPISSFCPCRRRWFVLPAFSRMCVVRMCIPPGFSMCLGSRGRFPILLFFLRMWTHLFWCSPMLISSSCRILLVSLLLFRILVGSVCLSWFLLALSFSVVLCSFLPGRLRLFLLVLLLLSCCLLVRYKFACWVVWLSLLACLCCIGFCSNS